MAFISPPLPSIPDAVLRMTAIGLSIDCTGCGAAVQLTICQSDKNGNAGKPMARHSQCRFFRFFPELLMHPDVLAIIPSSSRSPTPSTSPHLSQPGPSTQLPSSMQLPPSVQLPLMQPSPSSVQQPPLTQPLPSSLVAGLSSKKLRKKDAQCAGPFCHRACALRCMRGRCLKHCIDDGGCPIHPTGSNDCECLDEDGHVLFQADNELLLDAELLVDDDGFGYEQLQHALQASITTKAPQAPSYVPSLHDLLSAPRNPSAPSQHALGVPSTSIPHRKPTRQPRITNQLDPMWALDLHAQAQQEVEEGRIVEHRKEMERAAKHRFVLNWFDANDEPVVMQWVLHCPFFPQYQLEGDATLVESLGKDISKIEVYETRLARWIPALV